MPVSQFSVFFSRIAADSVPSATIVALAVDPRAERAYYERGLTHLSIQEYPEATADLERALALNPKFALSRYALGNVRYAMRDLPGAIQAYNEAIGIDPAIEVYVVSARGLALLESGNCKAAIQDFNKVLIINAKSPATLQNRARCLHRTGMYDEAIADFTRALYITPSDATLFAERGNSFLYGKDAATAERDINQALKLDPKNALALRNRGRLHIVQKKLSEALADFDASLALAASAEARSERLWILIASGNKDAAQQEIQTSLAQNPNDASTLFARGYLKMKTGDLTSGKLDMVEAVKRDPDLPERLSVFALDF